jgi:hypothetical protein
MAQQILVALKSEDRLSQMIPYIERIAKPGMRVVLLVRFVPQPASKAFQHELVELECPEELAEEELEKTSFTRGNINRSRSIEYQRLSAEHKAFLALEVLRKRGIEITVDVYTCSLRKAVKSYTAKGDVHLIMMRARRELIDFFHKAFAFFGLFKRPNFSHVLVLRPTHVS